MIRKRHPTHGHDHGLDQAQIAAIKAKSGGVTAPEVPGGSKRALPAPQSASQTKVKAGKLPKLKAPPGAPVVKPPKVPAVPKVTGGKSGGTKPVHVKAPHTGKHPEHAPHLMHQINRAQSGVSGAVRGAKEALKNIAKGALSVSGAEPVQGQIKQSLKGHK